MSYKLTLEVEGLEAGSFTKDKMEQPRPYLRLWGKGLPNGRWAKAVCFGETATRLQEALAAGAAPGEDPAARRPIVEATGEWIERNRKDESGVEKKQRSFQMESFTLLSGPSVELQKTRRLSVEALRAAERELKGGDVTEAYKVLEAFVARVARMPQPSVEMDGFNAGPVADETAAPEEAGLAKFDAMERRRTGAAPAEAGVDASTPKAPAEAVAADAVEEVVAQPVSDVVAEPTPETVEAQSDQTPTEAADDVVFGQDDAESVASVDAPDVSAESEPAVPEVEASTVETTPSDAEAPATEVSAEKAPEVEAVAAPKEAPAQVVETQRSPAATRPALPVRPSLPPRPGVRPAVQARVAPAAPAQAAAKPSPAERSALPQATSSASAASPSAPRAPLPRGSFRVPPRVGMSRPAPAPVVEAEVEVESPKP